MKYYFLDLFGLSVYCRYVYSKSTIRSNSVRGQKSTKSYPSCAREITSGKKKRKDK